jgi:hypothetical protein
MNTVEGGPVSAKELSLLEPGENPTFAARPSYATIREGDHWSLPLLLLTDRRLVISKEKVIGRRKIDLSVAWSEVAGVHGELWNGGGPQIQLIIDTNQDGIELIVAAEHAVDVESAVRSSYLTGR